MRQEMMSRGMIRMRRVNRYLWRHGTNTQRLATRKRRWHQTFVGYGVGLVLVLLAVLLNHFLKMPHFIWTPFCLIAVIVGFMWGVGPALFTMAIGFFVFSIFVVPQYDLFGLNIWYDFTLLIPFVFAQIAIAFLAAQHQVQYKRALVARQEAHAYAQELAAAIQQLESANRLKDHFLIRAAHELRTPLTTILGEAQLALRRLNKGEGAATEPLIWKKHFEKILARAFALHALMEEVIHLSSFRSGDIQLRLSSCDFCDLCREVIEDQRAFSKRTITFTCPPFPLILQADCERLSQVVINVVRNAIQYSPEHTAVNVSLRVELPNVLLQVQNEGPVFTREQQEQLFEPFYRTPSAEATNREGWGLGLTICKEIIERHGGRIWITSSEAQGIICSVQIPFQSRQDAPNVPYD